MDQGERQGDSSVPEGSAFAHAGGSYDETLAYSAPDREPPGRPPANGPAVGTPDEPPAEGGWRWGWALAVALLLLAAAASFLWMRGRNQPATATPTTESATMPAAGATDVPTDVPPAATASTPPVAQISGPTEGTAGQLLTFDGGASRSGGVITAYLWDLGNGTKASGRTAQVAYPLPGRYVVTLTVVDDAMQQDTASATVTIVAAAQQPPTASITAPDRAELGEEVTLDARGSTQGSNPIDTYAWQFGPAASPSSRTESVVTVRFDQPGTHQVVLVVSDTAGLSDTTSHEIAVEAESAPTVAPPRASIAAPTEATVGEEVVFDAGDSMASEPIVSYLWDFGDGTRANAVSISHAFATPGTFVVTLEAVDASGRSGTATHTITVQRSSQPDTPPTARITGPSRAAVGQSLTYDASSSTEGSNPIVRFAWSLGAPRPDSGVTGPTASGTFEAPGVYDVYVTVTDATGLSGSTSLRVTVAATLESSVWVLDGTLPGTEITATFGDGTVSGSGGCNSYSGSYEATAGTLAVSALLSTSRVCGAAVDDQEAGYLGRLQAAETYVVSGSTLTVGTAGGPLVYSVKAPPPGR